MENREQLINKLRQDVKLLQNKVEHTKLYNIRNFVARTLIKSGIAIDYALPFILSAFILGNLYALDGNAPFIKDDVKQSAIVQTIDTSDGTSTSHISYDIDYDTQLIEHSTGWKLNDKGLYETTITYYRIDSNIDLSNKGKIFSMTKEELDEALIITNIKTIQKSLLTEEDKIYSSSELIIITNYFESEDDYFFRKETGGENFGNTLGYLFATLVLGGSLAGMKHILVKDIVKSKLGNYLEKFRPLNDEEIEMLKKMLDLKKQNLALLSDTENNNDDTSYQYSLRK